MEILTQNLRVIRIKTKSRSKTSWRYIKRYSNSSIDLVSDIKDASDYTKVIIENIVKDFNKLSKTYGLENVDLIEVKITTEIAVIDMDDTTYLEERRKQALEKLSLADVKALGLEKLATYHKLKFHNTENVPEFIDDDGVDIY